MKRTAATVLLVCVVALAALLAVGAGGQPGLGPAVSSGEVDPGGPSHSATESRIAYFSIGGRGYVADQEAVVGDHPGTPYVWASESLELRTTVHTETGSVERSKSACAYILDGDRETLEEVDCGRWNATNRHRYVRLELPEWPAGARGTRYLRVELREAAPADGEDRNESEVVRRDSHEAQVQVIAKEGDLDGDGLSNAREVELGTDFTTADTAGNGLSDSEEVYQYGTDPLAADTTGDGVGDGTIARLGLPPTVPYVIHGATVLLLAGLAALVAGGLRLRRTLRTPTPTDRPPEAPSVEATDIAVDEPRTKEETVLSILLENDGRMKQSTLVDRTEWSKATVSRLLSSLEEEGRVEKIQVGRGNVVQLTRPDPAAEDEQQRASG